MDPINETTRPFKRASHAKEAAKWAGAYSWSECAANGPCWRFDVSVDADGYYATITASGTDMNERFRARPLVRKGELHLAFESYADGRDHSNYGLGVNWRGDFQGEEPLLTIVYDGKVPCVHFEDLKSKLGTEELCADGRRK